MITISCDQGDQIGRIFAQSAIVYFGQFFKNYTSSPNVWGTLFQRIDYVLILTINGLGYILGDFLQTHLVTLLATKLDSGRETQTLKFVSPRNVKTEQKATSSEDSFREVFLQLNAMSDNKIYLSGHFWVKLCEG
jgi:hypothetical protein